MHLFAHEEGEWGLGQGILNGLGVLISLIF
jgi:hypothetical protein